jgi:hypothetical protein
MYLESTDDMVLTRIPVAPSALILLAVLAVPTVLLGAYWAPLFDLTVSSVKFFAGL